MIVPLPMSTAQVAGRESAIVDVNKVTLRRGKQIVLRDLDLSLGVGITVLVGPNGAGKTTLLRALATLQRLTSGTISHHGQELKSRRSLTNARRNIGFLAQEVDFPREFTVLEMLKYTLWLGCIKATMQSKMIDEALEFVGMKKHQQQRLGELSTGLRRRAFLAQAIVTNPSILLLDEATAGVDTDHRSEFRRLIRLMGVNRCVVISTHLTEEIELLGDRVIALDAGVIRFDGSSRDLMERAAAITGSDDERPIERALRSLREDTYNA